MKYYFTQLSLKEEVWKSIHVDSSPRSKKWVSFSKEAQQALVIDRLTPATDQYLKLRGQIRVMVYVGVQDLYLGFEGQENWINQLMN